MLKKAKDAHVQVFKEILLSVFQENTCIFVKFFEVIEALILKAVSKRNSF